MTKGQRTIATLLAIITALLAGHLLVRLGGQEAQAQHGPPTRVIQIDPHHEFKVFFRLWSDGVIEWSVAQTSVLCSGDPWCEWEPIPDDVPPQPHARIVQIGHGKSNIIYRLWSNGIVERNVKSGAGCGIDPVWCGMTLLGNSSPPSAEACPAKTKRELLGGLFCNRPG